MYFGQTNVPTEIGFRASRQHSDPFNQLDLDVLFTSADGSVSRVPAFWAGDDLFKVRFTAHQAGRYTFETVCSDPSDPGLHAQTGVLELTAYAGNNPLYKHGRIHVAQNRRHFEHADGTPFFWLGDTQWQAFTSRLDWPHGFANLEFDRSKKGFSVVQLVAGPLSGFTVDESWHRHQANEAGWPWEPGWSHINPAFYDLVDLKVAGLIDRGLMPCLVGMWGYYLNLMGEERVRRHWRYLVARYGAYPLVWCLAGEVQMAVYDVSRAGGAPLKTAMDEQATGWTDVARFVGTTDPFHNLITTHPAVLGDDPDAVARRQGGTVSRAPLGTGRSVLVDESVLDFDMLQSGHYGYQSLEPTVSLVAEAVKREPRVPVVNGEVNYEGISGTCWQDLQRFQFWSCMTSGAAGYTYGAAGLWAMWSLDEYCKGGDSDFMEDAGGGPWQEVMHLPGSTQVGIGKRLFERYAWWLFEPVNEPEVEAAGRTSSFGTGIPGEVVVYYVPSGLEPESLHGILKAGERKYFWWRQCLPVHIAAGASYEAFWFDPRTGAETPIGEVRPDERGYWTPPAKPSLLDWVLILQNLDRLASRTS